MLNAIDGAESFEPDDILVAVQATDIAQGETAAGYGVKFGAQNQNERAFMMGMQWQDGKLVTVYPDEAAVSEMKISQ